MKLITWNVQWFCGLDDRVDVERVVAHARSMADFDVLCLQEVAVNYPQLTGDAGFDQVARLRELLPEYEIVFGAAVTELGRQGQRQQFGNLIATRLPIAQAQSYPLPYPPDLGKRTMPRICTTATVLSALGPIRVMTTHLEFYSTAQRMAQARALLELHRQACGHVVDPPLDDETGSPFQNKAHTAQAILCGDFNFEARDAEYGVIQEPAPVGISSLADAWPLAHGTQPHEPTFRLFDSRYGPEPICCDFVFVSANLRRQVRTVTVDQETKVSDHQPVLLELGRA
ncbi:MAG: endonuclease/exonuclease/phosphatase family protein [Rhodoferax sp.]|nr:endonuclease/exonuclease/phosphatase family protein [Rhodoferax sp.]